MSCLERKRDSEPLCDPRPIIVACTAPRPMREEALRQLLALNMRTGDYACGAVMSHDALIRHGVGLITSDKTEQLILPAHDSVRTFMFSTPAFTPIRRLMMSTRLLADTFSYVHMFSYAFAEEQESIAKAHLGKMCLLHIRHKAARSLINSSSQRVRFAPSVAAVVPSWIRGPAKALWSNVSEAKTVSLNIPTRTQKAPVQHDPFFQYARENWLACNEDTDSSEQWQLFSSIAMERNESWNLHPWPVLAPTRAQHLVGMFAHSVAIGHLPLLKLALQYKDSLPRDIFAGLLPNHEHLPALHVACQMGHSHLLEELIGVCNPLTICHTSGRIALHYAAESGHATCIQCLDHFRPKLETYVDMSDADGNTALHLALLSSHVEIALSLGRDFGADVFTQNLRGSTPIDLALDHGHGRFIREALQGYQVWLSLLVAAAEKGQTKRVQTLIWLIERDETMRIDPASQDEGSVIWSLNMALRTAVVEGHADVVGILLESDYVRRTSIGTGGQNLPFDLVVFRYYKLRSSSLQIARHIVGLLTSALTHWTNMGLIGEAKSSQTRPVFDAGTIAAGIRAAAEIGNVDAVRQLLDLWNNNMAGISKQIATVERDLRDQMLDRGVSQDDFAHLGITTVPSNLQMPIILAAVRQHAKVLALLLPGYNVLRVNEMMEKAGGLELREPRNPPMQTDFTCQLKSGLGRRRRQRSGKRSNA
jgi:hypothetical protein